MIIGKLWLKFDLEQLRTLALLALVFGGEATLYAVRERRHLWSSRPSNWMVAATVGDILAISAVATAGVAMRALAFGVVVSELTCSVLFAFLLDLVKTPVFRRCHIA